MQPIRVLQVVVSMDAGGIETMLMNYYRNIDRSKVQFDFLLHCKHKSYYEDEIDSLGGKIYRVPSYHPSELFDYKKSLKDFFKKHTEYKVVHSHIKFYGLYVLKAAKEAKVPVRIAHAHTANKFYKLDKTLPFRIYTRFWLKYQYTHVYACSPEAAAYIAPGKQFTIMNNAINANLLRFSGEGRIKARESLGINDCFVLGHIGRFTAEKNHLFILNVFKELLSIKPDSKLLLIGTGKLFDETVNASKDMGIYDNIIFTGVRKDIPNLLSAMDAYLFPSKFEGFPVSFIEAQANDLPCVISDTFTKTSVISDRVSIMSLEDSPKIWAQRIANIDTSLHRRDNTQLIINAGLDIKSNAKKIQNVYLEAYGYEGE